MPTEANLNPNEVINGIDGYCWIDGALFAEISEFEANLKMNYTDIPIAGKLVKGKKLTGVEQTGKVHFYYVSDTIQKKVADMLKQRKCPTFTFTAKVADPDAKGVTRVALYDVKLDEAPLLKYSHDSVTEYDINFTYLDYEYLDNIG